MKPLAHQNLYELLEVARDAPEAAIIRAWERAEALYGPGSLATYTLVSPDEAALLGRRLEEALAVLLDPVKRRAYDASLGLPPGGPPPVEPPRAPTAPSWSSARDKAASPAPPPRPPGAPQDPLRSAPAGAPILLTRVAGEETGAWEVSSQPLFTPAPLPLPPSSAPPRRVALVDESGHFHGEQLRRAREACGLSLESMCARTRIPRHHLESLEADQRDRLPAPVYLRGYLKAIARELRLDGEKVVRSYLGM